MASVIMAIVFLLAAVKPGAGYVIVFAFILILTFALTGVGIYSGLNHKANDDKLKRHNKIGLIGNSLIFLSNIGIVVYALFQIK
ncbi:MAG: hypothetical protein HYZ44_14510 [Bacteroidetes bacterium]|nr:hypothetical protein [Bacteroidota bacterium]